MFCSSDYKKLVLSMIADGYRFKFFTDTLEQKCDVLMRHDVDFSVECALKMALIEHDLKVKTNYFFLIGSPFYNLICPEVSAKIFDIKSMGHSVSLHFDATAEKLPPGQVKSKLIREIKIFESLFACSVDVVSFHRPTAQAYKNELNEVVANSYDEKFFYNVNYFSDSRGGWFYGHPCEQFNYQKRASLQVLTHPIWWFNESPTDRIECLRNLMLESSKKVRTAILENTDFLKKADFNGL